MYDLANDEWRRSNPFIIIIKLNLNIYIYMYM